MSGTESFPPIPRPAAAFPTRQGYSKQELHSLYALSRHYLTTGDYPTAEKLARGLNAIAPEFAPAWLVQSYISLTREDYNQAIFNARQALRVDPSLCEALLIMVIAHFNTDDYQTGGTYLGEVSDLLGSKGGSHEVKKIYRSQLVRFQERLKRKRPSRAS